MKNLLLSLRRKKGRLHEQKQRRKKRSKSLKGRERECLERSLKPKASHPRKSCQSLLPKKARRKQRKRRSSLFLHPDIVDIFLKVPTLPKLFQNLPVHQPFYLQVLLPSQLGVPNSITQVLHIEAEHRFVHVLAVVAEHRVSAIPAGVHLKAPLEFDRMVAVDAEL